MMGKQSFICLRLTMRLQREDTTLEVRQDLFLIHGLRVTSTRGRDGLLLFLLGQAFRDPSWATHSPNLDVHNIKVVE